MKKIKLTKTSFAGRLTMMLLCMLFVCSTACKAASDGMKYIIVWDNEGGCISFPLKEYPRFEYDKEASVIYCTTSTDQIELPLEDVHKYTVDRHPGIPAGIDDAADEDSRMEYDGSEIFLDNFAPGTHVAVYTTDGIARARYTTDADGHVTIPMNSWTPGVYIIKTNETAYKIYKEP